MQIMDLLSEMRELKECIKAGFYPRAYELAQNIDDELTSYELRKTSQLLEKLD